MRAWKGLKTAMGNVLRVEFKIAVEKSYLIIYTPENDSAREKREKDGGFQAEKIKNRRFDCFRQNSGGQSSCYLTFQ
jgi:hypothetical protein